MKTPPLLLSIETSGTPCSITLSEGVTLLAEITVETPYQHDRLLATLVHQILDNIDRPMTEVGAVAVSGGPGSFTGLRIGFAFAKGLCFRNQRKMIVVPTLQALAHAASAIAVHLPDCDIAAVVAAHDDKFYIQHFNNRGTQLTTIQLLNLDQVRCRITSQTLVCGPAAGKFREGIRIPGLTRLSARFISLLAIEQIAEEKLNEPATSLPIYVQEFQPHITTIHLVKPTMDSCTNPTPQTT